MALNFPSNPVDGQAFGNYTYNSTKGVWSASATPPRYTVSPNIPASAGNGDVWFNSETARSYIYYVDADTAQWVEIGGTEGTQGVLPSLGDAPDVDVTGLADGDTLVYDSATSKWVPGEAGGKFTVSGTAPAGAENGDTWFKSDDGKTYIYYVDADGGQWVEIASNTTGYLDIGQLNDVTIVSPTTGQALTYNGSGWVNATPASTVGSLTDTTISTPADGQALVYDSASGNWINAAAAGGVEISATAPVAPSPGDLWFNSTQAKVYVYYDDGTSSQWVSAIGGLAAQSGTDGQFLIHDGTEWVASALASSNMPTGSILQVVSTTKTDTFSMASATFADVTGLSVSITPQSTSSKILVSYDVQTGGPGYSTGQSMLRLLRDSTPIAIGDSAGIRILATTGATNGQNGSSDTNSAHYLDSPATVSTLTYKIQIRQSVGTGYVNKSSLDADNTYYGRTVSTITVMEVAG